MKMKMNQREILRYLGYGRQEADGEVMKLISECYEELSAAASPKCTSRMYSLSFFDEDGIDAVCFRTRSKNLRKNLTDCERIVLFAATLGAPVDLLIQKYNRLSVSKAVILQAAAAAMLEDYCDEENEQLRNTCESDGWYLRPRFSPGYGDFPLECQPNLIGALEAGKRVGITLTDNLLMVPSKSVTAVIGVSKIKKVCTVKGCEACGKTDCAYRRG